MEWGELMREFLLWTEGNGVALVSALFACLAWLAARAAAGAQDRLARIEESRWEAERARRTKAEVVMSRAQIIAGGDIEVTLFNAGGGMAQGLKFDMEGRHPVNFPVTGIDLPPEDRVAVRFPVDRGRGVAGGTDHSRTAAVWTNPDGTEGRLSLGAFFS